MNELLKRIQDCRHCENSLPHSPRPIIQAGPESRIVIIGQAPGRRVHRTGIPWNDPSGDRLREWLRLSKEQFYDPSMVAVMSMGFCYPGTGKSGDLPPRRECAPLWHEPVLSRIEEKRRLILLVGGYAQAYYLENRDGVTTNVKRWREFLPRGLFPLPHPSPRNQHWFMKNRWFETEVLDALRNEVAEKIASGRAASVATGRPSGHS